MTSPAPIATGSRFLARVLVVGTLALLFLGGWVTTYRVGMAVPDWPTTSGYGMFSYPLDHLKGDSIGVVLEHSHRLLGAVVGLGTLSLIVVQARRSGNGVFLLSTLAVVSQLLLLAWFFGDLRDGTTGELRDPSWGILFFGVGGTVALLTGLLFVGQDRARRFFALAANVAVIVQGTLGGARVVEDSAEYGFIHGTVAQAVFAIIFANLVVVSVPWSQVRTHARAGIGVVLYALFSAATIFSQAQLGAMTRHSGVEKANKFVMMHAAMALIVVGLIAGLLVMLRKAAERCSEDSGERQGILAARKGIMLTLGVQIVLGVATLIVIIAVTKGFDNKPTVAEAVLASSHVITGALLLAFTFASFLWMGRLRFVRPGGLA